MSPNGVVVLDAAAQTSGLLEARGANTFAFVHQSFQEYLAALRLVRPVSQAAARIGSVAPDPRWHEIIRLGVGHLSIALGEREVVAAIIDGLLKSNDPLEPFLNNSLRLALGILADQAGLRQHQADAIYTATVGRLRSAVADRVRQSLLQAMKPLETPPSPAAQRLLLELTVDQLWTVRMEAVRLLALAPRLDDQIANAVQGIFAKDEDDFVKAWAAWALWRQGHRNDATARAIIRGLSGSRARMRKVPSDDFPLLLPQLLIDPDNGVRLEAATVLGDLGQQATALPVLVKLLEDRDARVRLRAAEVLCRWGHQETVLPSLLNLLEDPDTEVRWQAATVLGNWGQQATALPVLLKQMGDPDPEARWAAAWVLGDWGPHAPALPAIVKLLECPDSGVRLDAARLLGDWGQQATALPALVKMLNDRDAGVRLETAEALSNWGLRQKALPALVKLMEETQPGMRSRAAEVLGDWGQQATALPALVKLLEDPHAGIRLRAVRVLGNWGQQATALPALVKLLGDPHAAVRRQAAATLGYMGQKERAPGTTLVAEIVLRALTGQARHPLADAFRGRDRITLEARRALAALLGPQTNDTPFQTGLRRALFELVWHHFATTG